jgi:DNA-directed RNA polymerase subunit RPC12/RpoP
VGKLAKILKLPVVVYLFHGHYLVNPTWGNGKKRKLPILFEKKYILSKEQLDTLSIDEINDVIRKEMHYNEFEYQKQQGILIKEKYRAEGIHKILYKCPHCASEFKMSSSNMFIKCTACDKEYLYKETSELECLNGVTIFSSVTDWLNWEREEVRKEILNNNYLFEEELQAYSVPHPKNVVDLGYAKIKHNEDGFVLDGNYNNNDFHFTWTPLMNYSLQTEYSSPAFKKRDIFGLSTFSDTLMFVPKNNQVIQKLYFAVEELYKIKSEK